jgi:hypothetical protein
MRKDNNGGGGKIPEMCMCGKLTRGFGVGYHERVGAVRADRSCLALCPVTYKFVPLGTENSKEKVRSNGDVARRAYAMGSPTVPTLRRLCGV